MLRQLRFVLDFAWRNRKRCASRSGRTALQAGLAAGIAGLSAACQACNAMPKKGEGLDTRVYTHLLVAPSRVKKNQDQLMFPGERIGPHERFRYVALNKK
jgi:hypothetical protein